MRRRVHVLVLRERRGLRGIAGGACGGREACGGSEAAMSTPGGRSDAIPRLRSAAALRLRLRSAAAVALRFAERVFTIVDAYIILFNQSINGYYYILGTLLVI